MIEQWDWGEFGRKNTYSVYRVDPFTLQEYGDPLPIHEDLGSITFDKNSDNFYSATLNFLEPVSRDYMVRVKQHIQLGDNKSAEVTHGTFFIDKCPETHIYGHSVYKANCYSPMMRYTKDVLFGALYWDVGTRVTDAIKEVVEGYGGKFDILPGNNMLRTFSVPISFPDDSKLYDMISDMAYWINCYVYPDAFGYIMLAPYTLPEEQPVSFEFEEGRFNICKSGYQLEDLQSDSYNRWKVFYSNSEGSGLAIAQLPSTHPYSFERIGRWVTYSEQIQNPCSESELQALANRRAAQNSVNDRFLQIEFAYTPDVEIGNTVRYTNTKDGPEPIQHDCEVTQMEINLNVENMATAKLRILR